MIKTVPAEYPLSLTGTAKYLTMIYDPVMIT